MDEEKTENKKITDRLAIKNRIQIDEDKVGLATIPSTTLILGQCKSGKTYLLKQLLLGHQFWFQKFANIVVFSGTIQTDPSWNGIYKGNLRIFDSVSDNILDQIINYQEQMIKNDENWEYTADVCIIIDDQAFDVRSSRILDKLMVRYRHKCISIIVLAQYIKMCTPCMRLNFAQIISFGTESVDGISLLYEAVGGRLTKQEFVPIVLRCTQKPHSFISFINNNGKYSVWQSKEESERKHEFDLFKKVLL
jgi:hypothetical protein